MWSRSYRIIDFRADPDDITRQVRDGHFPSVRLVMDKPIGREIKVTIELIAKQYNTYSFSGFLGEDVVDFATGLKFYRETELVGQIAYWKGQITMTSSCFIKKGGDKDDEDD